MTRQYAKRLPPVTLVCPQCYREFTHTAAYIRDKQKQRPSGNLFCSKKCYYSFRWGSARTIDVTCQQCGKQVMRQLNQILLRGKYGPFCSQQCYGEWRSENLAGEDSPGWKGGYTLDYGGSHWKRQRRKARRRDNSTCQDCGKTEQEWGYALDVHHIVPYDTFDDPKQANHLDNLVTLCRECHAKFHLHEMTRL